MRKNVRNVSKKVLHLWEEGHKFMTEKSYISEKKCCIYEKKSHKCI